MLLHNVNSAVDRVRGRLEYNVNFDVFQEASFGLR
jgi:hypothetical protein